MKRTATQTLSVLAVVLLFWAAAAHGQSAASGATDEINSRIWSLPYWMDLAERGLVEVAPEVPVPDAVYTSSVISAPNMASQDSPDVPVTTLPTPGWIGGQGPIESTLAEPTAPISGRSSQIVPPSLAPSDAIHAKGRSNPIRSSPPLCFRIRN